MKEANRVIAILIIIALIALAFYVFMLIDMTSAQAASENLHRVLLPLVHKSNCIVTLDAYYCLYP